MERVLWKDQFGMSERDLFRRLNRSVDFVCALYKNQNKPGRLAHLRRPEFLWVFRIYLCLPPCGIKAQIDQWGITRLWSVTPRSVSSDTVCKGTLLARELEWVLRRTNSLCQRSFTPSCRASSRLKVEPSTQHNERILKGAC